MEEEEANNDLFQKKKNNYKNFKFYIKKNFLYHNENETSQY